jgi:hypothetical protein
VEIVGLKIKSQVAGSSQFYTRVKEMKTIKKTEKGCRLMPNMVGY